MVPRRVKLDSEHYHALMKKEHPDWNFCPTCNASLSEAGRSSLFSILLTDRESRFIVSISLSPENGTGVVSPFSLDGASKFPVWAEPAQIGSQGLAKERLFEETIIQHVLPAFRYGLKVSKFTGKDTDQSAFSQLFMKYAQKEMSEKAFESATTSTSSSFTPETEMLPQLWKKRKPQLQKDGLLEGEPQAIGGIEQDSPPSTLDDDDDAVPTRAIAGSVAGAESRAQPAEQMKLGDVAEEVALDVPQKDAAATGVLGFDRIFGGGVPRDKLTLVSGESGAGKSIFAIKFLLEGAKRQEPGILAISEGDPLEILEESEALGIPIVRAIEEKKIFLIIKDPQKEYSVKTAVIYNSKNNSEFIDAIRRTAKRTGARRIVVDSLTGLISGGDPASVRKKVSEITQTLSDLRCTVLATGSVNHGSKSLTYYGVEEFFFSALISLKSCNLDGSLVRYLHVPKMKGARHSLQKYVFEIQPQSGIVVCDPLKELFLATRRRRKASESHFDPEAFDSVLKALVAKISPAPALSAQTQFNFEGNHLIAPLQPGSAVADSASHARKIPPPAYTFPLGGREQGPLGLARESSPHSRVQQSGLKTVEGRLPAAAADNPWSFILSDRDEQDEGKKKNGVEEKVGERLNGGEASATVSTKPAV